MSEDTFTTTVDFGLSKLHITDDNKGTDETKDVVCHFKPGRFEAIQQEVNDRRESAALFNTINDGMTIIYFLIDLKITQLTLESDPTDTNFEFLSAPIDMNNHIINDEFDDDYGTESMNVPHTNAKKV